ncbi:MAG: NUDIX domain-containing protein [Sumerlaeia bacterium]
MPPESAGVLIVRHHRTRHEVLLVHPGGPFFRKRDLGAWTIPKGMVEPKESPVETARRELAEELGWAIPPAPERLIALGTVRQKGGKIVHGFAMAWEGEPIDPEPRANSVEIEWPPRSGKRLSFPEVDRAEFFPLAEASQKILAAQVDFLDRLAQMLERRAIPSPPDCPLY